MAVTIDYAALLAPDLPAPAPSWQGRPPYNFIGGHVDAASVPVEDMITATATALRRDGATLSTYGLESGPLGYRPLREFVAAKLKKRSGLSVSPDGVLITSGSIQALELVYGVFCCPGDTVLVEQFTYAGTLSRLRSLGVNPVGIPLDESGMRVDRLAAKLAELKAQAIQPKFIYVIPTVQNPDGSIMPEARRAELLEVSAEYGVPIFEDECYADLLWTDERPPAIAAMDRRQQVIHCGSFSKTIAPALRVGYVVAGPNLVAQMAACKEDGGTGALEQMMLSEYCRRHFDDHVAKVTVLLKDKLDVMIEALEENFGTTAEFTPPPGGIFLWVSFPDAVDATKLATAASARGVAINPGPDWSADAAPARSRIRLCFGNPTADAIREGVKVLADVCHEEFGIPVRSANIERNRLTG